MTYPPPDPYAPPPEEPNGVPPTRSFNVPPTEPYAMPRVDPYTPPTEQYAPPTPYTSPTQQYSPPTGPYTPTTPYTPADPYGAPPPTGPYSAPPAQSYAMQPVSPYTSPPPAPAYGAPYGQPTIMVTPVRPNSTVAVWALVLGIVGVLSGWCLFAVPCVAAVILGHVGLAETRSGEKAGRGMAIAGLVMGYVALAPAIILFFWLFMGGILSAGAAAG
jgi:hypothetical protein